MSKHERNWGKEIKDLGVLIIVVGAIMVALILYLFVCDSNSILASLVENHIFFLAVGGGILLIVGIIVRSIGKSKEAKAIEKKKNS